MIEQQRHEMILGITHPSGAEEWDCPICRRRLLISWEPAFKKKVLEAGDEYSVHSGGKGGLKIGNTQVTSRNDHKSEEDARLAPWESWMNENNFEDLWNDDQ